MLLLRRLNRDLKRCADNTRAADGRLYADCDFERVSGSISLKTAFPLSRWSQSVPLKCAECHLI